MELTKNLIICSAYRYAIGRHSYIISLARDIPRMYYNEFTDKQKESVSKDIRLELFDQLNNLIPQLYLNALSSGFYDNPLSKLFEFIKTNNIDSMEDLLCYETVYYDVDKKDFITTKHPTQIKDPFSPILLDDLIPWETFASCFDIDKYKTLNGESYFRSWTKQIIRDPNEKEYRKIFGWDPIWINLNSFLKEEPFGYIKEDDFLKELDNEERNKSLDIDRTSAK